MTDRLRKARASQLKAFSDRLLKLLTERRMRSVDIVNKLGVTKQAVSFWVNGKAIPTTDKLCRLAELLDVTVDYLTGTTDIRSRDDKVYALCSQTNISETAALNFLKAIELDPTISTLIDGLSKEILFYASSNCSQKNNDDHKGCADVHN